MLISFFHFVDLSPDNVRDLRTRDCSTAAVAIFHAFNQPFSEVEDFVCTLGEQGYSHIQVSPAQKSHQPEDKWFFLYQPFDYGVIEGLRDEDDLKRLIDKAHGCNVNVIADVVFNHMANVDGGEQFEDLTKYPGLATEDFQTKSGTDNDKNCDVDYDDENRSTEINCWLGGLSDLDVTRSNVPNSNAINPYDDLTDAYIATAYVLARKDGTPLVFGPDNINSAFIDGTTNFAANIPFYSVSLALLQEGAPVLGVIYDPLRRECFSAQRGMGAWLGEVRLNYRSSGGGRLASSVAAVDFKRLRSSLARRLVEAQPYRSQRNFGSCALEWCWLAAGRFHVYLHGGMKLWDYAAGSLILAEAGGHSCTLEGEPVVDVRQFPRSVVAGLDADLFAQWCSWLGISASGRRAV